VTLRNICVEVNERIVTCDVEPRLLLTDFLRQNLRLTGTHVGCEHGVCGACTVIVDGVAVRSCLLFAVQANGVKIRTVEGLADAGQLTALQEAFHRRHALQCGFCTAGILTTMWALLREEQRPSRERIREVLSGNLCRCTGYIAIVEAVFEAATAIGAWP
jgi:aerobic-type carbon monoxide dehydrogenase small subunit (CoxS/CutS family)